MAKLKFGVIGVGGMGNLHLSNLKALSEVEVVAISDINEARLAEIGEKYNIPKCFTDYRKLLESGVDAVVVATPPFAHRNPVVEALERGIHVFLEKPMAANLKDAEEMYNAAIRSSAFLMVGYCLRFHDLYEWIKEQSETRLGEPVNLAHVAFGSIPAHTWLLKKELSGGMLNENGVHVLYVMYWYAGKFKRVQALSKTLNNDISIEDNIAFQALHEKGAFSSFIQSWSCTHPYRSWAMCFENGTITFDGYLGGEVKLSARDSSKVETKIFEMEWQNMYRREIEHFVHSIMRGEKPVINEVDGLEIQKAVDAAYRSAETGQAVEL